MLSFGLLTIDENGKDLFLSGGFLIIDENGRDFLCFDEINFFGSFDFLRVKVFALNINHKNLLLGNLMIEEKGSPERLLQKVPLLPLGSLLSSESSEGVTGERFRRLQNVPLSTARLSSSS